MNQRRLVGMSMGARKRAARAHFMRWNYEMSVANRAYVLALFSPWDAAAVEYKRLRGLVRIGQRLRPCPGCQKCGSSVRRFAPTAGWKSPRKWVIWDGSQLWMIARTWKRKCAIPNLSDYLAAVEDGTWKELFCDGSGVLPARERTVRR